MKFGQLGFIQVELSLDGGEVDGEFHMQVGDGAGHVADTLKDDMMRFGIR